MPAQAHPTSPALPGTPGYGLDEDYVRPTDEESMEAEIARQVALRTRELGASLARYQTMVDLATENICVGQDGLLRFANPPCLALLGTQVGTMADRPMIEFIHPDDREFVSGKH